MHQRAALNAWEDARIDLFGQIIVICEDHAATWAAQSFMCGGGNHMRMTDRARIHTGCNQAGIVRHIHHQNRADRIGNFAHPGKIDLPFISRSTTNNHFRALYLGHFLHHIVID